MIISVEEVRALRKEIEIYKQELLTKVKHLTKALRLA